MAIKNKGEGIPFSVLSIPKRGFLLDYLLRLAGEEWSTTGEDPTPYRYFSVVDSTHALIETTGYPLATFPPTITRYRDPIWAQFLDSRFQKTIGEHAVQIFTRL